MKKIYFKKPLFSIFFHNLIFKIEDKISRIIFFEQQLFKEMMINSLLIVNYCQVYVRLFIIYIFFRILLRSNISLFPISYLLLIMINNWTYIKIYHLYIVILMINFVILMMILKIKFKKHAWIFYFDKLFLTEFFFPINIFFI
jgi:hypothetical protein